MKRESLVKCVVCGKEILSKRKIRCSNVHLKSSQTIAESDDGVLFKENMEGRGFWFCNSCWKEIIQKIKENKK